MTYDNVLQTIGNTPLIKLNNVVADIPATVYAKVESFNPGQSAKDRIALHMIEKAEREGKITEGATIVEATSGNTGFSIAMICALKGYHGILCVSSKASEEKISLLKSLGAEVVICPPNAKPEDPDSYYSRAESISREVPNSFYMGQNWNFGNSEAHYLSTGPEIWRQTEGKITHYVCCVGTGGTMSGTARFLKEQNPKVNIVGVDAYGSVLKKYWQTGKLDKNEIHPYKVEGLGKTIIPDNVDFDVIDEFIKVNDRDSAHRCRDIAKMDGMLTGYSSGAALQAVFKMRKHLKKDDVVVVLFSDHGSRYLGKIYNDTWMRHNFPELMEEGRPSASSSSYSLKRMYRKYKYYRYYINKKLSI